MSHVGELAYLHSRDITFAVFSQGRNTAYGFADARESYEESVKYRDFMGWSDDLGTPRSDAARPGGPGHCH
nr:hypothetical protein [Streptomyces sp. EAG2]